MPDSFVRTRCSWCNAALGFEEWSAGTTVCRVCATSRERPLRRPVRAAARPAPVADEVDFDRLLSDMSDDSVDGLIAALEAELERQRPRAAKPSPVAEVLADAGIGQSPRDLVWAAWGFSGGFAANVVLAKYAQMQSGAPITDFLMPMLLGGLLCGGACAAIGWGLARLRDR